jgi:hypothetical protein
MEDAQRSRAKGDPHAQTCTRIGMRSSRCNARGVRLTREGSHAPPEVKSVMTLARTPIRVKRTDASCALLVELRRTTRCGVGGKCRFRRRYGVYPYNRHARRSMMARTRSTPRHSRPRTRLANHAHRPEQEERRVAPSTKLPSTGAGLRVMARISNSGRPAKDRPRQSFVRNRRVR